MKQLIISLFILVLHGFGQESKSLSFKQSSFEDRIHRNVIFNSHIYAPKYHQLDVFEILPEDRIDFSSSTTEVPGAISILEIHDSLLYIINLQGKCIRYSLLNPLLPRILDTMQFDNQPSHLFKQGNELTILYRTRGTHYNCFKIYDISVPESVRLIRGRNFYHDDGFNAIDLVVDENDYLVISTGGVLHYQLIDTDLPLFDEFLEDADLVDIEIYEGVLFCLSNSTIYVCERGDRGHFEVLDEISAINAKMYFAEENLYLFYVDGGNNFYKVFDISSPSDVSLLREYEIDIFPECIGLHSNKLFLTDYELGIYTINTSEPAENTFEQIYWFGPTEFIEQVYWFDPLEEIDYVFTDGLPSLIHCGFMGHDFFGGDNCILKFSDGSVIDYESEYDDDINTIFKTTYNDSLCCVYERDELLLYVKNAEVDSFEFISSYDFDLLPFESHYRNYDRIEIIGSAIYCIYYSSRLLWGYAYIDKYLLDNELNIRYHDSYMAYSNAIRSDEYFGYCYADIDVFENCVFAFTSEMPLRTENYLYISDITRPRFPDLIDEFPLYGYFLPEYSHFDSPIYFYYYTEGHLRIADVTNPRERFDIVTMPMETVYQIYVENDIMYTFSDTLGLSAFDISNIFEPVFWGNSTDITCSTMQSNGHFANDFLFIPMGRRGLDVYDISDVQDGILEQVQFNIPQSLDIDVYPNPFNSTVFITIPESSVGKTSIEIFDISGKLHASLESAHNQTFWQPSADTPTGVYIVTVQNLSGQTACKRIVYLK